MAEGRAGHATLAGPVAANSSVAEHLSVHGGDSALGVLLQINKSRKGCRVRFLFEMLSMVVSPSCGMFLTARSL